jgi:hypothetical protein
MILEYLENDPMMFKRTRYEIIKEKNPSEISTLKTLYPIIKENMPSDKTLRYTKDETKIILDYLSSHIYMASVAYDEIKKGNPAFFISMKSKFKDLNHAFSDLKNEPNEEKKSSSIFSFRHFKKSREEKENKTSHTEAKFSI